MQRAGAPLVPARERLIFAVASPVVEHGLQGAQVSVVAAPGLESTGPVVEAHGHSCSETCGIFLDQKLNLCLLHWQVDSLPLPKKPFP